MSNDKLAATGYVGAFAQQDADAIAIEAGADPVDVLGPKWNAEYQSRHPEGPTVGIEQDPAFGVSEQWWPQTREGQDIADLDIKEWVGQALGAASACWSDIEGAGVFNSTQCAAIADALNKHIMGLMVALVEEGEQRLRVQEAYLRNLYEGTVINVCAWCGVKFGTGDEGQTKARLHVQTHHAQPCKHEAVVD